MKYVGSLFFLVSMLPMAVEGAVTINEIAWMGDAVSANHEWIELYNDDGPTSVDGWTLTDGDSLNISLVGTIPADNHVVLERTSDESAPGAAFLIYTGALKNTGATLTLRRADGGIEDQVSGGEDWSNLGGDNTSKNTAQYTVTGWITAEATPGMSNKTESVVTVSESTTSSVSGSSRLAEPTKREPMILKLPGNTLGLNIEAPDRVFVNQSINFDVDSQGVGNTIKNSLKYDWNFGDTHVAENKNPSHSYSYPGTYVVHATAEYGRQKAEVVKEITVLPIALSLTKNKQGDIQINNDSPYSINISEYRLRANLAVAIPVNTWLASKQTITVPRKKSGASAETLVALYDNQGTLVASIMPAALQTTTLSENPSDVAVVRKEVFVDESSFNRSAFQFISEVQASDSEDTKTTETQIPTTTVVSNPNESNSQNTLHWPVLALIALLSVGCVVVLMQPLVKKDSLDSHE